MKFHEIPVTLAVKDCTNMVTQKVLTKRLLAQYLPIVGIIRLLLWASLLIVWLVI